MRVKTIHRDSTLLPEAPIKASGLILITMKGLLPDGLKPGDHFLAKTKISPVYTFSTPGSFNYKKHLAGKSIFLKGWINSPGNIVKVETLDEVASLVYFPERIRHHIANFLDNTLTQPSRGLYKAILIGDRHDVSHSVLDSFIRAGCMHILAISGMHMGLLAFVTIATVSWLLKRSTRLLLQINVNKAAVSISLLPLIAYAFIAGFNIPVLRALLMTSAFILAIIFDRPGNLVNHILTAAFLILLWKPTVITTASFQLSFGAVISIALIYPLLINLLFKDSTDSLSGFSKVRPLKETSPFGQGILKSKFIKWLLGAIVLSLSAMLGTLPLLLFHFNRISLIAPLTSLLVEPLICFWSLIVGIIACFFIPLTPGLAQIFFKTGSAGLIFSERICAFFSAMEHVSLRLPTPSAVEIALYYILLLSIIMTFHLRPSPRRYAIIVAAVSFVSLLAIPAASDIRRQNSTATSVSVLDVGHGAATVLQLPHNKNILLDGGGAAGSNFNIGERVIGPFLWHKKIGHLDTVIITHPHADHYNGLAFILNHFRPKELWINGATGHDPEYGELLNLAKKLNIIIKIPKTDEILFQSGSTRLLCVNNGSLGMNFPNQEPNINDLSIVLKLETADNSFLFPADISAAMANTLVAAGKDLQADVLLAPHHGSKSSMSQDFIKAVEPEYIAVSVGRNNPFNLPDESFYTLEKEGIRVLLTGRDGTLTFTETGKKMNLSRYQVN
jgi:competence protein ComEC